jgi:predicted TIM-barrel fold metal-dependent hydrolase
LPIIDTHHHLWDRNRWTYLLPELLADLNSGHNIVATVFEECRSMYRADRPVEMRPILPDCHVDYYFARNGVTP